MKPFAAPVLFLLLLAAAGAQSPPSTHSATRSSAEVHSRDGSESLSSEPEMGVSLSSLSLLVSQRDHYKARVDSLRKEIAGLQAKLAVDPRNALRDKIESITRFEVELLRLKTSAADDTQLMKTVVPWATTLTSLHEARQRQLSALEVSVPLDLEKTARQLFARCDELQTAEALLSGLEDQVAAARTDREFARGFEDLKMMNKDGSLPTQEAHAGDPIKK